LLHASCDSNFGYSLVFSGYGFVDFETNQAAEVAVQALQAQGIQAQMAKVQVKTLRTVLTVGQWVNPWKP